MLRTIPKHSATKHLQADIKARLWARSGFDGQQLGHEHHVADGDAVELHT